jgi:hypothetical protein
MRKSSVLMVGCLVAAMLPAASFAQPGPRGGGPQQYGPQRQGPQYQSQPGGQYYYNGRWVDQNEWQRHGSERDRWAQNYQRRKGRDDSGALVAGILGFALGAAIVGSQQQAQHARSADQSWDIYCAKKYHSYDRHSRTFLGKDGLRHYCQ